MNILPYKTADSSHNPTSRAGLAELAELIVKLSEMMDRAMSVSSSNRSYAASTLFNTFMLLLHEGGRCLDDVCDSKTLLPQVERLQKCFGFEHLVACRNGLLAKNA